MESFLYLRLAKSAYDLLCLSKNTENYFYLKFCTRRLFLLQKRSTDFLFFSSKLSLISRHRCLFSSNYFYLFMISSAWRLCKLIIISCELSNLLSLFLQLLVIFLLLFSAASNIVIFLCNYSAFYLFALSNDYYLLIVSLMLAIQSITEYRVDSKFFYKDSAQQYRWSLPSFIILILIQITQFLYYTVVKISSMEKAKNSILPPNSYRNIIKTRQNQQIAEQLRGVLTSTMNNGWVNINNGRWGQLKIDQQIHKIQQWSVDKVDLNANDHCQIVKDIQNIRFTDLRILLLKKNGIESVQVMSKFYLPNLEELWLDNNNITNFSPLKKVIFPSLNVLCISENKQQGGLQQLARHSQWTQIQTFFTYTVESGKDDWGCRWILLSKINKIICLDVKSDSRLEYQTIYRKIKNKCPFADIF